MANSKFQDQIDKSCSGNNWDQGNDTYAPNDQAMSGGVSTVKQKCNAATNEEQEDDGMAETYGGASMGASTRMQAAGAGMGTSTMAQAGQTGQTGPEAKTDSVKATATWKDSTMGGNSTPQDAGGHDPNGSQTMQGGGPERTENHDGPFYGGTDDPETGGRGVQTGSTGASSTWRERAGQGPEGPTMTGFTGDPTDNGQVNSQKRNTVESLKGQTTATAADIEPKVQNAANDAKVKAENAANTAQGKLENAANTVGAKAGGVMDAMKNGAENFFNVDLDGDGKVGNGAFGSAKQSGLQDPDLAYAQRASMAGEPQRRATTAVAG